MDLLLVEHFREAFAEAWSQLQWWASVSFGLIALTSFAREQLNVVVAICLSLLYGLFTAFSFLNTTAMVVIARAARMELDALRDSGDIGGTALSVVRFNENLGFLNGPIFVLCSIATFAGTLAYLWYTVLKQRGGGGD